MGIRVLDIGQCGYDSAQIEQLLKRVCGATTDHCSDEESALRHLDRQTYDLILVNRLLDIDRSSGLDVIQNLKSQGVSVPIMLVSNLEPAQQQAIELGAVRGFGKSELQSPVTAERLRSVFQL